LPTTLRLQETYEGGVDEPVDEREFDELEDDVDSPPPTDYGDDDDDDGEKITLDRFKLALKYEQKQVRAACDELCRRTDGSVFQKNLTQFRPNYTPHI